MRFESQLSRMYCQMFSTGLSSGHFGGRARMVMLAGIAILLTDAIRPDRRGGRRGLLVRSPWRFPRGAGSSLRYCRRAGSEPRRCPVSGRWRQRYRSMRFADPAECSGKCRAWPTSRVILFFWPIRASSLEPNFYLTDVDRFFARDFIQARWELFLKSSIAPSACA